MVRACIADVVCCAVWLVVACASGVCLRKCVGVVHVGLVVRVLAVDVCVCGVRCLRIRLLVGCA